MKEEKGKGATEWEGAVGQVAGEKVGGKEGEVCQPYLDLID